jgi:hypothetical protein
VRQLETKSRKATLAKLTSIPLRLLIKLSLRADQDIQSLSVDIQKLRETGRILAQRLNRVKKKPVHRIRQPSVVEARLLPGNRSELVGTITCP